MNSGIYKIVNTVTNDFYIGSSTQLKIREKQHFNQLIKGIHNNKFLQNSFNKYKEANFVFEIISICPSEYCLKLEQWFIDNLKPTFNNLKIAGNSLGYKHTLSSLEKIKKINRIYCSKQIYQYDINRNFIKIWKSCSEFARFYGISRVAVIKAIKKLHKCKGFIISYSPLHCDNLVDN